MLKQEDGTMPRSPRGLSLSGRSPFSGKEKKEKKREHELLICTQDLTRIWLRFSDRTSLLTWFLTIDGLIAIFFSSSLLDTVTKSVYLREQFIEGCEGGSIKVGDDEEWTYIGATGRLTCSLTTYKELNKNSFIFDGQFVRAEHTSPDIDFYGEWDGMNIFCFADSSKSGEQSARARRLTAKSCYNWNATKQTFHMITNNQFAQDKHNTWGLTRNFLARTDGMGGGWVQVEGDTPICLAMFLNLFYAHLAEKN